MREHEYRGKELKSGKWIYGGYFKHYKRQPCPINDSDKEEDVQHLIIKSGFADWNMPRGIDAFEVIPETLGCFIGLYDINGKKIYTKDIVKFFNTEGEEYVKEISWSDKYLCYCIGNMSYQTIFDSPYFQPSQVKFEVIGDIIDNPEILKENV